MYYPQIYFAPIPAPPPQATGQDGEPVGYAPPQFYPATFIAPYPPQYATPYMMPHPAHAHAHAHMHAAALPHAHPHVPGMGDAFFSDLFTTFQRFFPLRSPAFLRLLFLLSLTISSCLLTIYPKRWDFGCYMANNRGDSLRFHVSFFTFCNVLG